MTRVAASPNLTKFFSSGAEKMMNLDDVSKNAMTSGYSEIVLDGRLVSAALRVGKGGNKLSWSLDGCRIALPVLRVVLNRGLPHQPTLFDLPGLPVSDGTPGGSALTTLCRVPAVFVPSVNAAYAQYMRESEESISFADFLGLVLVAGLEGFGDD